MLVGITTEEIDADGFGFVTQFGFVNKVDTSDWELGDLLYSDPANPGQLTNVKPSAPSWTFSIAAVTRVHANTGRILVRAIPGLHLHDLVDADISSLLNSQALVYNSSASVWNNSNIVNSISGTENEINISASVGNITIGLPDDVTILNDLTVLGNLTVSGSTTTLNTTELLVEDNIITLNSGVSGSPSINAGIEIERGTSDNVSIRWNEDTNIWQYTNDGTNYINFGDVDGGSP
jgi:hypothetical protein